MGAYIGYFPVMLCRQFEKIYAVEPHPANMAKMMRNLRRAGAKNVIPVKAAVSDGGQEEIPLFLGNTEGTHSLLENFAGGHGGVSGVWRASSRTGVRRGDWIMVKTTTLEELLSREPEVDLVKVDVEGAEWRVLKGAEPVVDKIKAWLVEIHFRNQEELKKFRNRIEEWMERRRYNIRWLDFKHIFAWR